MREAALKNADGAANSALDVILAAMDGAEGCAVTLHTDYNFDVPEPDDILPQTEAESDAKLTEKLMWEYPERRAAGQPLKLTVTGLLRQLQTPDETEPLIARPAFLSETSGGMRGAERGTAYHRAMQCVELAPLDGLNARAMTAEIARQMDELAACGRMTQAQREAVSPNAIARFLESETGRRLRRAEELRREWPFNVMMRISEALTPDEAHGYAEEEILVQGTIDCCFIEDGGWVLLDYKTDRATDAEALTERYRGQLRLYALALERITGIPVREIRLCLLRNGEEISQIYAGQARKA